MAAQAGVSDPIETKLALTQSQVKSLCLESALKDLRISELEASLKKQKLKQKRVPRMNPVIEKLMQRNDAEQQPEAARTIEAELNAAHASIAGLQSKVQILQTTTVPSLTSSLPLSLPLTPNLALTPTLTPTLTLSLTLCDAD